MPDLLEKILKTLDGGIIKVLDAGFFKNPSDLSCEMVIGNLIILCLK